MSNYKLSSVVDVYSSGSNAQINMYNSGGTFAVNVKAPSVAANIPFNLPSTAGSNYQFLTYSSGAPSTWTSNPGSNVTSLPMNITFITGLLTTASTTSTTFTNVGVLYFFGTTTEGTPSAIYAVIGGVAAVDVEVRLFDNTNAVVIGTSTAVTTTTTPQVVSIPVGTIATTAANWYVQIRRATSGTAQIWSIHVLP